MINKAPARYIDVTNGSDPDLTWSGTSIAAFSDAEYFLSAILLMMGQQQAAMTAHPAAQQVEIQSDLLSDQLESSDVKDFLAPCDVRTKRVRGGRRGQECMAEVGEGRRLV